MKEKPRELKAEQPNRPKFVPCERETFGGAQRPGNGTTCCGGQMFFWANYQGKLARFAKDCACKISWLAGFTPGPSKNPQAAGGDAKAKAAGE